MWNRDFSCKNGWSYWNPMAKYDTDPSFSKYLSVTFLSEILPGNKFHFFDKTNTTTTKILVKKILTLTIYNWFTFCLPRPENDLPQDIRKASHLAGERGEERKETWKKYYTTISWLLGEAVHRMRKLWCPSRSTFLTTTAAMAGGT